LTVGVCSPPPLGSGVRKTLQIRSRRIRAEVMVGARP
jgi:hypothetical protein